MSNLNTLKFTDKGVRSLVEYAHMLTVKPNVFITINPNPNVIVSKVKRGNKTVNITYEQLPHQIQYEYLVKCIELVKWHIPGCYVGCVEMKQGRLHAHMLVRTNEVKNEVDMAVVRKEISLTRTALKNRKNDLRRKDFMHNIVFINKPIEELVEYLEKQNKDIKKYFKNYYYICPDIIKERGIDTSVMQGDNQKCQKRNSLSQVKDNQVWLSQLPQALDKLLSWHNR